MRMSGFMLGSLVGAAAAVYFMRGGKMNFVTSMGKQNPLGKAMNNAMGSAVSNMMGRSQSGTGTQAAKSGNQNGGSQHSKSKGGLEKVNQLVNQDPQVKEQVHQILKENSESVPQHTLR